MYIRTHTLSVRVRHTLSVCVRVYIRIHTLDVYAYTKTYICLLMAGLCFPVATETFEALLSTAWNGVYTYTHT